MSKTKHKTMSVFIHNATVTTGWRDASIAFEQYADGSVMKKAVLLINGPNDIAYIRDQCNQIESYWRRQLEALKP